MDYTALVVNEQMVGDNPNPLVPLPTDPFTWDTYVTLLQNTESSLYSLFQNVEDALAAAEYAVSLADHALDSVTSSSKDLKSQLAALKTQVDRVTAQSLPVTGGAYTHLITESFNTTSVRDLINDFSKQPLRLVEQTASTTGGCPPRPPLQADPNTQTLHLQQEGESIVFSGIPGAATTLGGLIEVDKIYGTPVQGSDPGGWNLSVGSREALSQGFNDNPLPSWVPPTYESGGAVRLHIGLTNPSPITQVRLRGIMDTPTLLLETVCAVNSSPNDITNPDQTPSRAVSLNGTFTLGNPSPWIPVSGSVVTYQEAPGRTLSSTDRSIIVNGLMIQTVENLEDDRHYTLRYRIAAPYTETNSPASSWQYTPGASGSVIPVAPESALVRVYFYDHESPNVGIDSALATELFRDPLLQQGGLYGGWLTYVRLVKAPPGTKSCAICIGTDPFLNQSVYGSQKNAVVAYSDVWLADEAITRSWSDLLPSPSASNLTGPSVTNGVKPFVAESEVDSLDVPIGNDTAALAIGDVWVCLSQPSPVIEPASSWTPAEDPYKVSKPSDPYGLSVPSDTPQGRAARDPILLHQARYQGRGAQEYENPVKILGQNADIPPRTGESLFSVNGLWRSILNRGGQKSASPNQKPRSPKLGSYWKNIPGYKKPRPILTPIIPTLANRWPNLWAQVVGLSKAQRRPVSRMIQLMSTYDDPLPVTDSGSLYVYTMGLSSLSLVHKEYAPSGTYVTVPLKSVDSGSAIAGEIHEVSVLTDPPLASFGQRLRVWVIPDTETQNTSTSPYAILSRAIPLDSSTPRATFHSSEEQNPGIIPATSDLAALFGFSPPAFYVNPSLYTQTALNGLDPDGDGSLQLDHTPYINRETIWNITAAISSGSAINPNIYDANAVRMLIDVVNPDVTGHIYLPGSIQTISLLYTDNNGNRLLSTGASGYTISGSVFHSDGTSIPNYNPEITFTADSLGTPQATLTLPNLFGFFTLDTALTLSGSVYTLNVPFKVVSNLSDSGDNLLFYPGYRPVEVTLKLSDGKIVLPDSIGKPRPGEAFYQQNEILTEATDFSMYNNVSSTDVYSTAGSTAQTSQLIQYRSFQVANTPIVSGPNGASIQLYWHQSLEFDPASGGILTRYDVLIPSSEYSVSTQTGQITIKSGPPNNYAAFDQIRANYYWKISDIAPREWFPYPGLDGLYNHDGSTPTSVAPTTVQTGYDQTGQILVNNNLANGSTGWFTTGGNASHYNKYDPGNRPSPGGAFSMDKDGAQSGQKIPYRGPGVYDLGMWIGGNTNGSGPGAVNYEGYIVAQVEDSKGNAIERYQFHILSPTKNEYSPDGAAFLDTTQVPEYLLTQTTPPAWFANTFSWYPGPNTQYPLSKTDAIQQAWNAYLATMKGSGDQIYFQWPNYAMVTNPISGSGNVVSYDYTAPAGAVDNSSTFTVVYGNTPRQPNLVQIPFQTPKTSGYLMNFYLQRIGGDAHHGEDCLAITEMDATFGTPHYENQCPPGYTYDPTSQTCLWNQSSSTVTGNPTNLADILKNPIQQTYPVTRNVTNYASSDPATLTRANLDPLSPDYYPVFEYRIDPGNKLTFADDFTSLGTYAGTQITVRFSFLDINPRLAFEILPDGQSVATPPNTPTSSQSRSTVDTPEIQSIHFLVNARY